ncbi:hypothetical protein SPHINGO361_150190 [Sphingomonas sp. EC-HK361]|nr:hypothetical protein SPHINGO361_150190 [Sphingomonas sp. EC-HK361]
MFFTDGAWREYVSVNELAFGMALRSFSRGEVPGGIHDDDTLHRGRGRAGHAVRGIRAGLGDGALWGRQSDARCAGARRYRRFAGGHREGRGARPQGQPLLQQARRDARAI